MGFEGDVSPSRGACEGAGLFAGVGEASFWADPATVGWFNSSRQPHDLAGSDYPLATILLQEAWQTELHVKPI
jgi:hypothetical protein